MADDFASLTADLRNAGDRAQKMAGDAIAKTAADITNDAKVFAPVDTGNLKNSIGYDLMQDGGGVGAEIGPTVSYANFWSGVRQRWRRGRSWARRLIGVPPASNRLCDPLAGR